jgi:hypothetical protein
MGRNPRRRRDGDQVMARADHGQLREHVPMVPRNCRTSSTHWRAETDDVPVGIDEHALMLAPWSVLGNSNLDPCRGPCHSQLVGVFNEEVRRRGSRSSARRYYTKMNLDTVPSGEAVPTLLVSSGREAKSVVVLEGDAEVADGKNRGNPFQLAHVRKRYPARRLRFVVGQDLGACTTRSANSGRTLANRSPLSTADCGPVPLALPPSIADGLGPATSPP